MDSEFLHRIHGYEVVGPSQNAEARQCAGSISIQRSGAALVGADVGADSVDREVIRVGALAVGTELPFVANLRGSDHHPGGEIDQRLETPAVERQILHKLTIHHRAHGSRFRVDQRDSALDRYALRNGTNAQRKVDRDVILHVKFDVILHHAGKAFFRNIRPVNARWQLRLTVKAGSVGFNLVLQARIHIG